MGFTNVVHQLVVPGSNSEGDSTDVSDMFGLKTVEVSGTYSGAYIILGSHDNSLFVPVLAFDSGAGEQAFRQTTDVTCKFFKVRNRASVSSVVIAAGALQTFSNAFISFPTIPINAGVGPRETIDTWALTSSTLGFQGNFSLFCSGNFVGTISVEASLLGNTFNSIGGFTNSTADPTGSREFSPIIVPYSVRFARLRVMPGTRIFGPVRVTAGGFSED